MNWAPCIEKRTARVAPETAVSRPALPLRLSVGLPSGEGMTYSEKLKHPLWQRKRLEILQRDEFMCQKCYDSETTLHVHHRRYIKGREPWDYEDDNFITLCAPCHEEMGETDERIKQIVAEYPIEFIDDLVRLLEVGTYSCTTTWHINILAIGVLLARGDCDAAMAEAAFQQNPILLHYGILAGALAYDVHTPGQAKRDRASLEQSHGTPQAIEWLKKTIACIEALDQDQRPKRARWTMHRDGYGGQS